VKEVTKRGHLTSEERDKISILHAQEISTSEIARILSRHKSTISRELNRKEAVFFRGKYIGSQTHKLVRENWNKTHIRKKLQDRKVKTFVIRMLKLGFSPELIAGRLKTKFKVHIHHETIYRFIYKDRTDLTKYLVRRPYGRKHRISQRRIRAMKPNIPNRIDISERSLKANKRLEFGHFEADTVLSSKKGKSALIVLVDRTTRKTSIKKLASKTASEANKKIIICLKKYKRSQRKSITYDNGCEFCWHEKTNKKLKIKSYFCKPYSAWEKGTVENINGLIRRFFPKGTNFDKIKNEELKYVEDWINNRPMKVLGFKTPNEKFREITSVAIA